ncbi:MAG: glycosyltransferase family 9 protein [Chitinophagaceae bacterium]|nr:glycosyltransferase family 9 protein [Chitinophagaceae bacterium]
MQAGNYINAEINCGNIPFSVNVKLWLINTKLCIENNILKFFIWLLFKKPNTYKKVLIFRTGSLGDSINAIPSIQSVVDSYPAAKVDILTNAGRKNLVGIRYLIPENLYSEIIDYNELSKKDLFKSLKKRNYDLVIQLPQVDANFLRLLRDLLIFSRIATQGMGWFISQTTWFRKTQAKYLIFENENKRLLKYLKTKGLITKNTTAKLNISKQDKEYVQKLISNFNFGAGKKKISIIVGAKRSQNRWPIEYFKKVVDHFSRQVVIILIGSKEDQILAIPLVEIPGIINFCGLLTPMQSAAMISLCDVTLSNDTGPMHMSYAVQTPTIALFSSRDLPGKWYPPEENNIVFRANGIKCEACFSEICTNNICMQAIKPEDVITAIEKIIQKN